MSATKIAEQLRVGSAFFEWIEIAAMNIFNERFAQ